MADAYHEAGNEDKEMFEMELLDDLTKIYGPKHRLTLKSMHRLSIIHRQQTRNQAKLLGQIILFVRT